MSLKPIIKTVKEQFSTDAKMEKYEDILRQSIDAAFENKGSVAKGTISHIFISLNRGADINTVKEIYANVGIKLSQRFLKHGVNFMPVLCISVLDFNKLNEKQREFFKRTTNSDRIKRS